MVFSALPVLGRIPENFPDFRASNPWVPRGLFRVPPRPLSWFFQAARSLARPLKTWQVFGVVPQAPDLVFSVVRAVRADFCLGPFMVFLRGPAGPRLPRKSPTFWLIFGDFRARPTADPAALLGVEAANFENLIKPVVIVENA